MDRGFPDLVVAPGEYLGDWKLGSRVLNGQIGLAGDAQPRIDLKGELELEDLRPGVRSYPQVQPAGELRGWLWSGQDVITRDVHIETVIPEMTIAIGRYSLVGLNLNDVDDDAYEEVVFQATGLDLLLGRAPLKSVRWPPDGADHLDGEFAATGDPQSTQKWELDGTTITCSYWAQQSSVSNPYRFELRFAPVVHVVAENPADLDRWLDEWVTPVVRLLALVTREPQRLSWLELRHRPPGDERRWPVRAQVFGTGIAQEPYVSEDAEAWRDPQRRPILDLASSGLSLPALIVSWRDLDTGGNPFVELFRLVMFQRDLPKRAQFLYLVQALEALQGYEHRSHDQRAAEEYAARRGETIERIGAAGGLAKDMRFLKQAWSKRPRDDLSRRLRSLVRHKDLPATARSVFDALGDTPLAKEVRESNVENAVRHIRNDLAHGNRNYSDRELRRWTVVLDALCRGHLLRLLGCPTAVIERAFQLPER